MQCICSRALVIGFLVQLGVLACASNQDNGGTRSPELTFQNATASAGLTGWQHFSGNLESASLGGASAADYDDDGRVDLLVTGATRGTLRLYRNRGTGEFEDVTEVAGLGDVPELCSGGLFFDADGDDDLDLLLTFYSDTPARHYEAADGRFVWRPETIPASATMSMSAACADLDADGLPEVHLSHWVGESLRTFDVSDPAPRAVLLGNRGGVFEDVGAEWGLHARDFPFSFTGNFVDLDSDGRTDLVVASDYGQSRVAMQRADGFVVSHHGLTDENGMGASIGDFDNDGDMDWFVTSIWAPASDTAIAGSGNRLYQNDGEGGLVDVSDAANVRIGYWGWAACAADFNNDGWLDIYHVNGFALEGRSEYSAFATDPSVLFLGQSDGRFVEVAASAGVADTGQGRGLACLDYDSDGDVDVLISNAESGPRLFENTSTTGNGYLSLRLRSKSSNTRAIGARVRVSTAELTQMREVRCGNNYLSQDPYALHVGLGGAEVVDTVEVAWPSGRTSILRDVPANSQLELVEPGTSR